MIFFGGGGGGGGGGSLISSMIVAVSGFLMTSMTPCGEPGHQRPDDERVHQDDERDPDHVPGRVSLLSCEIHVVSTPVAAGARWRRPATLLVDELLAADDADLGEAEPLRRRHHAGDDLVLRAPCRAAGAARAGPPARRRS